MTRLSELAELIDGSLHGDGMLPIAGAAPLALATEDQITLVDAAASLELLAHSPAAAAVVPIGLVPTGLPPTGLPPTGLPLIEVENPHAAFSKIVVHFRPPRAARAAGVSPQANVDPTAKIDPTATVYPAAFVDAEVVIGPQCTVHSGVHLMAGCRLGSQVTVMPGAVFYENTVIGDRCLIHAGTVLGAHGFGYAMVEGRHQPAAQLGNVVIENDVEIGAGVTIDRGTYGPTIIGEGTKIDNQVMIAHNCRLGKHNLICSQVGIAGSATTGDYVVMAGQVGVPDHVNIGERAVLGAKAGVLSDIPAGATYVGVPATPHRQQFLMQAALARLPELLKQVRELEKVVVRLQARGDEPCQEAA